MKMKYYETLYIINANLADEDYEAAVIKFNDAIEKNKGVLVKVDEWGKKTLAYKIKKLNKGYYVLLLYCGKPGITEALERALKLDERILKYQTIKLSDSADPEALKAKVEKDEIKVPEKEAGPAEEKSSGMDSKIEETQEDKNGL